MSLFQKLLRRWQWMLGAVFCVISFSAIPSLVNPQLIPEVLPISQDILAQPIASECTPGTMPGISDPVRQLEFEPVGRVAAGESEYRLYQVLRKQQPNAGSFTHLVRITNGRCQSLATNAMGDDDLYLHQVVSPSIARHLALAQLQHSITNAGGNEQFKAQLNQQLQQLSQSSILKMSEEEVWAFKQQQLPLPFTMKAAHASV